MGEISRRFDSVETIGIKTSKKSIAPIKRRGNLPTSGSNILGDNLDLFARFRILIYVFSEAGTFISGNFCFIY
jgi:hypothetical protein